MNDRYVTKQRHPGYHLLGMVVAVIMAWFLVQTVNGGYWTSEPWPGGRLAQDLREERPWLEAGINELIRWYSLPLGVVIFCSLYGAMATGLEMRSPLKYLIIPLFLYTSPAVMLVFFIPFVFLGGIVSVVLVLMAALRRRKRTTDSFRYALFVCGHHLMTIIIGYAYGVAWFDVFGD